MKNKLTADGDFEVFSSAALGAISALEIYQRLNSDLQNLPKKEIEDRTGTNSFASTLLAAAVELSWLPNGNPLFRKKDDANATLASVWLSIALKKAREDIALNAIRKFDGLRNADLREIAKISQNVGDISKIKQLLGERFGIVLIYEPSFKSMKVDGVAAKFDNGTPIIVLSLRYPRYDYYWFTLLHELSHIALHYDQISEPICDNLDEEDTSSLETEANRLAADSLIPRKFWDKAEVHRTWKSIDLESLAGHSEIHPAIAAGLLRKRHNNYKIFSAYVNEVDVRKILLEEQCRHILLS